MAIDFSELNGFEPGDVGCGRDKRPSPSQHKGICSVLIPRRSQLLYCS